MLTAADPTPPVQIWTPTYGPSADRERLLIGDPSFCSVVDGDDIFSKKKKGLSFDDGMHVMKEAECHHGVSDAKGEISEKQSHLWVQLV